ncbi:DUF6455 family protein [Pacificoceanicola onchidii]|uniref:DUF6455 family protein n=1 Tax=Pacificoceanicola onchidii TaxID=2562685 RepID=UPI0014560A57|nr:DUF6455 family protein [Pacificoceanicola onchidii]
MPNRTTLRRHAYLVDEMANAQGLDLEEQVFRGTLSIPDLDDAVLRCTGCTDPGSCEVWLESRTETAGAPPSYCRNHVLFAELRRTQQ